ncbi:MAG: hypothetical protein AAFQ41_03715 [Cyanobacteria bacterium J06623_7]
MNIGLPAFLEIAIGLVFIYLILCLLASEIQELLAGFGKWRAKHLKKSIFLMLLGKGIVFPKESKIEKKLKGEELDPINTQQKTDDESKVVELIRQLYNHYEISSLKQSSLGIWAKPKEQYGPSYIPADSFTEAIIDVLAENYGNSVPDRELIAKLLENSREISEDNPFILPEDLAKNLSKLANRALVASGTSRQSLQKDLEPEVVTQIFTRLKTEIKSWFERSQARTSGTYKRNTKIVLFFIGLAAAIFANADTFHIVENLHDENVREAVVAQASSTITECQDSQSKDLAVCIKPQVEAALELNNSPIGWPIFRQENKASSSTDTQNSDPNLESDGNSVVYMLKKLPGYIVTALAITMGAPFWFDLLKKLVNVRNAGPKPKPANPDTE